MFFYGHKARETAGSKANIALKPAISPELIYNLYTYNLSDIGLKVNWINNILKF